MEFGVSEKSTGGRGPDYPGLDNHGLIEVLIVEVLIIMVYCGPDNYCLDIIEGLIIKI